MKFMNEAQYKKISPKAKRIVTDALKKLEKLGVSRAHFYVSTDFFHNILTNGKPEVSKNTAIGFISEGFGDQKQRLGHILDDAARELLWKDPLLGK